MKIDAHQHFWSLKRGDYHWLTPERGLLYRDFLPDDLRPLIDAAGIKGTILVQAAATLAETEFMLSLSDQHDFILGVVGWVDMADPGASAQIEKFNQHPKFCGIRPMLQGIQDTDWVLHPALTPAFETLIACDLTFDALITPRHLPTLLQLLKRHPKLRVVIDHGAKPNIADGGWDDWADPILQLAQHKNVYCKLSGLITECGDGQNLDATADYGLHLLKAFGPSRVMFGSDWPVCLTKGSFDDWHTRAHGLIRHAFGAAHGASMGANAAEFYRLK
ncbi:MAG: amidohydrolase family protein [Paracoccaceae bacterium]